MKHINNKRFLHFLILLVTTISVYSINEKSLIYNAYLGNDMKMWKNIIEKMNDENGKSNERNLELLNYEYGYIGWCLGTKNKKEAKIYIDRGEKRIELLEKTQYKLSMIYAYKSAFNGYQIALNKSKAPFYGGRSVKDAEKSIKLDANNYFAYIQLGNIDYFKPALFGGSKKNAMVFYQKAEKLMMKSDVKADWNYLSLITQIAKGYEELEDDKNAEIYYKKALTFAPNFKWVKNELYPTFLKNKK